MIIPTEMRLNIYGFVFGADTAILEGVLLVRIEITHIYFTSSEHYKSCKHASHRRGDSL